MHQHRDARRDAVRPSAVRVPGRQEWAEENVRSRVGLAHRLNAGCRHELPRRQRKHERLRLVDMVEVTGWGRRRS